MDIIAKLKSQGLINSNEKVSPWISKKITEEDLKEVFNTTSFLSPSASLTERIKALQLNITSLPVCKYCGTPTRYFASYKKYADFCSIKCQSKSPEIISSRQQTCFKKYGATTNLLAIPEQQRKANSAKAAIAAKAAINERGFNNVMDIPEVKAKHKATVSSDEFQSKRLTTICEKYGSFSGLLSERDQKLQQGQFRNCQEWKDYKKLVSHYTRHSGFQKLVNYENRGRSGQDSAYHLDHKVSMMTGFANNIHPSIIGSIENLEYIPWKENRNKWNSNSQTLGELFAKILINN